MPIRLSDDLNTRAVFAAADLGISLNALVAVALDDYLKRHAVYRALELQLQLQPAEIQPFLEANRQLDVIKAGKRKRLT